jgi:hypothetical protein
MEIAMGLPNLLGLLVALAALVAIIYILRRKSSPTPVHWPDTIEPDPARALFAAAGDEPPTEDQIAQARLGGVRGNPKLGAAQIKGHAAQQVPKHIDDGHVA